MKSSSKAAERFFSLSCIKIFTTNVTNLQMLLFAKVTIYNKA